MFMIKYLLLSATLLLASCGNMNADINPSGDDLRPQVSGNTVGNQPSQIAADFSAPATNGSTFKLSDNLIGGATPADAVVMYFSMWCPICLSHTDHIFYNIIPQFQGRGTTKYVLVDFVSGNITATTISEASNGYAGSIFTTVSDINQSLINQFQGAMGKTIVIDKNGVIQMNEDFKTGAKLTTVLTSILP